MTRTVIRNDPPYSAEKVQQILAEFNRDGFYLIRNLLSREEVETLRDRVDRMFANPQYGGEAGNQYNDFIGVRLFEVDPVFEDMLTREPLIGLAEAILGNDCHLMAQNVVRNKPGVAIDFFHADDLVMFPVAEGMTRHDPRLTMPVHILTFQIPLTDIEDVKYGPTEYVPGSHYAGRQPDDPKNPVFEGQKPVPVLCRAGDVYLHNGQCWHRGAPNTSDRVRYLFQMSFGRRWVSQRFYPFVNYQLPAHVLERADDRRKRVLGIHPKGAYG